MASNGDTPPEDMLGVTASASPEEVRQAYLQKVREFPPDRAPEQFERIRYAYDQLSAPENRFRHMLDSADPDAPFASLASGQAKARRFAGPRIWLDVIQDSHD